MCVCVCVCRVSMQALMLRSDVELQGPAAKQLILGLGLMFLGKQELVEATLEVGLAACEHTHIQRSPKHALGLISKREQ